MTLVLVRRLPAPIAHCYFHPAVPSRCPLCTKPVAANEAHECSRGGPSK